MNFIEDLKWRGALNQVTDEAGLLEAMADGKIGAYVHSIYGVKAFPKRWW